jgi:hypothetical protein
MSLTLDDDHRYWLDGAELLGCTTALKGVGMIDARFYNDEAQLRGTWVHDRIEEGLNDTWRFQVKARKDSRYGYVEAAKKFLKDHKVSVLNAEMPLADPLLRIAGKPDVIGLWTRPGHTEERFVIPDWKTGQPEKWHRYQTAWYLHLAKINNLAGHDTDRLGVYLRADGTYTTRMHEDRTDWKIADAVRLVEQAKRAA